MPQLDKVTFLSQFFWLCVFFLGFYVISLKYFLPQMSRALKYRKKRLNQSHQGMNNVQDENVRVRDSIEKLLETGLKNSKDVFQQNLESREKWLIQSADQINQTKLKQTNHTYLHSLGEKSLLHNLCLQGSFRDFSETIFMVLLMEKLNGSISRQPSDTNNFAPRSSSKSKRK